MVKLYGFICNLIVWCYAFYLGYEHQNDFVMWLSIVIFFFINTRYVEAVKDFLDDI